MDRGLQALVQNPQNNLRVFLNCLPVSRFDTLDAALRESLPTIEAENLETPAINIIMRWMREILCEQEPDVLRRIYSLQQRDILDVEGAHLVLLRLARILSSESDSLAFRGEEVFVEAAVALVDDYVCSGFLPPPTAPEIRNFEWNGPDPPTDERRIAALE